MRHAISLCLTMVVVWLLFSGYYTVFILSLGAISVVATVYIVLRMETLDHESHPVHLTWSVFSYIPWLILEIIKANLDVAKRVISGGSSIDPAVLEVKSTQKTELGQVIFANSITLTPGTTTMRIEDDTLLVHTVAREVGEDLLEGDMDRRVTRMEGHG